MFKLIKLIGLDWLYGVLCHFQQYFSYILVVSFIGEGNPKKKKRSVANNWQTLSHNVVSCTSPHMGTAFELTTSVVIGTDCTGSCKLIKLKMCSLIELLFYVFSELRISVTMATVFNGVLDVTYRSDVSLVPLSWYVSVWQI